MICTTIQLDNYIYSVARLMLITQSTQQTRDSKFETLIEFSVGSGTIYIFLEEILLQGTTRKVVLLIVWQPLSVF